MTAVGGKKPHSRDGMQLRPTRVDGGLRDILREHRVEAVIGRRMEVGELPVDHERLGRPRRLTRRQGQRPSARNGDATRPLDDSREREQAPAELLHERGIDRLLVELCVRVRRSRPRSLSETRRQ